MAAGGIGGGAHGVPCVTACGPHFLAACEENGKPTDYYTCITPNMQSKIERVT
jgi:hypothetical protein